MKSVTFLLLSFFITSVAQASLVFSDVTYTANTVSFVTTGDLSGYDLPERPNFFSIGFEGDLFSSGTAANISWSNAIFTGATLSTQGHAGDFDTWNNPGAWLQFSNPLSSTATAMGVTTILTLGENFLNESSLTGEIVFNWDVDATFTSHTELGRISATLSPVPVPAAAWLFGSALLGFFGFSRRKANA